MGGLRSVRSGLRAVRSKVTLPAARSQQPVLPNSSFEIPGLKSSVSSRPFSSSYVSYTSVEHDFERDGIPTSRMHGRVWTPYKQGELDGVGVAVYNSNYALALAEEYKSFGIHALKVGPHRDADIRLEGPTPTAAVMNYAQLLEKIHEHNAKNPSAPITHVDPRFGYGSEDPSLARLLESEGVKWMGPTPESMELGDKQKFRNACFDAGLPVSPGMTLTGPLSDQFEQARAFANDYLGASLIFKPPSGGGGGGIAICKDPNDLDDLQRCLDFAKAGSAATHEDTGEILVEIFYPRIRHVEIQVLAENVQTDDRRVITLIRDCSAQQKGAKTVETTLPPHLEPYRESLETLVQQFVKTNNYVGPGTFEFGVVIDEAGNPQPVKLQFKNPDGTTTIIESPFVPIEMNVRFQVELPTSEHEVVLPDGNTPSAHLEWLRHLENGTPLPQLERKYKVVHERVYVEAIHPSGHAQLNKLTYEKLANVVETHSVHYDGLLLPGANMQVAALISKQPISEGSFTDLVETHTGVSASMALVGTAVSRRPLALNALTDGWITNPALNTRTLDDLTQLSRNPLRNQDEAVQGILQKLAHVSLNGPSIRSRRSPEAASLDHEALLELSESLSSPNTDLQEAFEQGGFEDYFKLASKEPFGLEAVHQRDEAQSDKASHHAMETFSVLGQALDAAPNSVALAEGNGGANKQSFLLSGKHPSAFLPHFPNRVLTELMRGFCIQGMSPIGGYSVDDSQKRRALYESQTTHYKENGMMTGPNGELGVINKIFVAGNVASEIALSVVESIESGQMAIPTVSWDSHTTSEEVREIYTATCSLIAFRQLAKDAYLKDGTLLSINDFNTFLSSKGVKDLEKFHVVFDALTTMNVSDFALAQSVIPIGGHLKHPGTHIAFDAEVIIASNTVMNSVYKFVFEMNSLFDVNHTHRKQGEE